MVFAIEDVWIAALGDADARELIARLCKAEVARHGGPPDRVRWGGDQRAADGGADVRIQLDAPLPASRFGLSTDIAVQVKAQLMPRSEVIREMTIDGEAKPIFEALLNTNGAYFIASTRDSCSDSMLAARQVAMREATAVLNTPLPMDFWDRRFIADWVEDNPSVSLWLRSRPNVPDLQGWQPYGPWAHGESDLTAPYHVDDTARIGLPGANDPVSIMDAIVHMRAALNIANNENGVSVRLIGLSGVGKTRFAQALFDASLSPETALDSSRVVYTDIADMPEPTADRIIEALSHVPGPHIIIVDNCGSDTHGRLTRLIAACRASIALLTIEYDIADDIPEGTQCYSMTGSSQELLETLLRERFHYISQVDARRLAELSEGNARIAFAIASTLDQHANIGELRDAELFGRLFNQRQGNDANLRETVDAISLVYSFNGEEFGNEGELSQLLQHLRKTPFEAARDVTELQRRGLVQSRGPWRALLPHALANRIARDSLSVFPSELLYAQWIAHEPTRLSISFCHRLGYLHEDDTAQAVAAQAFGGDGALGMPSALSPSRIKQFIHLAPVAPESALSAIERALHAGEILPRELGALVVELTYEAELFERAAAALATIAVTQIDEHNPAVNSEISEFEAMFAYIFSGTMAPGPMRCTFLRRLIYYPAHPGEIELGLRALTEGLKTQHFSTSRSLQFGSHRRSWGWQAPTQEAFDCFFTDYIDLVFNIIRDKPEHETEARAIIERHFRGLWQHAGVRAHLVDHLIEEIARQPWPGLYIAARETQEYDGDGMEVNVQAALTAIVDTARPKDLLTEIRVCVILRDAASYLEYERDYVAMEAELSARATALGRRVVDDPVTLAIIRTEVLSVNHTQRVEPFGYGVGLAITDIGAEIEACVTSIEALGNGRFSTSYLMGLGRAWQERDQDGFQAHLDTLMHHETLSGTLPDQQQRAGLDDRALQRFVENLSGPQARPYSYFRTLWLSRESEWSDPDRFTLLAALAASPVEGGLDAAIESISLYCHRENSGSEPFRLDVLRWLARQDWSNYTDRHNSTTLASVADAFMEPGVPNDLAAELADAVDPALYAGPEDYIRHDDPRPVLLRCLFAHASEFALNRFATEEVIGDDRRARHLFSGRYGERGDGALSGVPPETLVAWCQDSPELRFPFAGLYAPCVNEYGPGREATGFSDHAVALVANAPNPNPIIAALAERLPPSGWSGSRATIIETRMTWFDVLQPEGREDIAAAIEQAREQLSVYVVREREHEERRNRGRDETFE